MNQLRHEEATRLLSFLPAAYDIDETVQHRKPHCAGAPLRRLLQVYARGGSSEGGKQESGAQEVRPPADHAGSLSPSARVLHATNAATSRLQGGEKLSHHFASQSEQERACLPCWYGGQKSDVPLP